MRKPQQTQFFKAAAKTFGGSLLKHNPREKRTLSFRRPIHLVMRSKYAKNQWSFLHKNNKSKIDFQVMKQAKANGIRVYDYVNVGNHLHMNLLIPSRLSYQRFVRSLSGIIPRLVMGIERGGARPTDSMAYERKAPLATFWEGRPFTRILSWGREFRALQSYFQLNHWESLGQSRIQAKQLLTTMNTTLPRENGAFS